MIKTEEETCRCLSLDFSSEFSIIFSENGNKISFNNEQENVLLKGFLNISSEEGEDVILNVKSADDILSLQLLIPFLKKIANEIEASGRRIIIRFNSIMEEILL